MTSAELIRRVVEMAGLGKTDVEMRAVWLRRAGLLRKGGRGLNAEDMQASDVVNLLLAIATSKTAKGAMFSVPLYRNLVDVHGRKLGAFLESEILAGNRSKIDFIRTSRIEKKRLHEAEAAVYFTDHTDSAYFHREPREELRFAMYREDSFISGQLLKSIAIEI